MNEEMRKEFEEWFSSYCNERGFNYSFATLLNGEFASWPEHNAFLGWQASREAMNPIKLPDFDIFNHTDCCFDGEDEHVIDDFDANECRSFVISQIKKAGYEVE